MAATSSINAGWPSVARLNLELDKLNIASLSNISRLNIKSMSSAFSNQNLHGYLGSFGRLSFTVFISLVVWYISTGIYAWWRLRKFSAVHWLANFSYLWLAKTTYSGRQYWVHRELQNKHKLVRIGPNELMTDDPAILRKISAARSNYDRDSWYTSGRFNPYHDNLFSVLRSDVHTQFKSRTSHAYSSREIPDMEVGVNQQINTLIRVMRDRYALGNQNLELGEVSCFFTMDVITRLAFGQEFGYLAKNTDHYSFPQGVRELWPRMSTSADIPWIRNVLFSKTLLRFLGPKSTDKAGFGALMGVAEQHVGKRFASGAAEKNDMLGSFIQHGLSQKECEVEGLFMIVAGTESTASTIRAILVHTMTSPRVYARLKGEIQAAVKEGRAANPITIEQAKKLPYLQAVVNEGLRIRTPLLGLLPKVVPPGGDTFHGQHVPAGTAICANVSSLLRSKEMFGQDADIFRPERFLELKSDKDRIAMERNVEMAFGSGQWQCVGKTIATMELFKSVFEIFRNFDLQLVNPTKPCDVLSYGVFLESNLFVKVTPSAVG
ncbi:uncharacterized protein JN550_009906 [Neoarthrinium moseri]|uniref:uncharacterized protein n=1 Tax=Neoarthrinium moseri TaxID=1658444 RepID=UPI001FDD9226|nr:uncharacterized protein JN550_009906 [Neoarthrinium moseri]KAI1862759.1 hypothetical protein JN550_009906 [Neoarthrinium moseri]